MASRKGQFKKGGGRVGGSSSGTKTSRARRTNTAIVIAAPRSPTRRRRAAAPARRAAPRRRRRNDGLGKLIPLGIAALALGYVSGDGNVPEVKKALDKVPGHKTLGTPLTIGLGCLAANKFIKPNKYLKLIGTVGAIVGAYQLGVKKLDVKWVGDPDDGGPVDDDY